MIGLCEEEGCGRSAAKRHRKRLLCISHVRRALGHIDPSQPIAVRLKQGSRCSIADCERKPWAKRMCHMHYLRRIRGTPMEGRPRVRNCAAPEKFTCHLPLYVRQAMKRRAKLHGLTESALARALMERWALTEGAESAQKQWGTEEAWRHSGGDPMDGL